MRLIPTRSRRAMRRAQPLTCEAISLDRYALLGVQALDISESGLLISAEDWASPRESVLLHIFGGSTEIVAEAEVARVIEGRRDTDWGPAFGLRFTRISRRRLRRLMGKMRSVPPPVPARHLRVDYAASLRAIPEADADL